MTEQLAAARVITRYSFLNCPLPCGSSIIIGLGAGYRHHRRGFVRCGLLRSPFYYHHHSELVKVFIASAQTQ